MVEFVGDRVEVIPGRAGMTRRVGAESPTAADYKIPANAGDLRNPGPLGDMPKPLPVDAWKGAPEIRAPGESHPDNPPAEEGVHSPSSVGVPQSKPVWSGNSNGPDPQPSRPQGHPALRGQ